MLISVCLLHAQEAQLAPPAVSTTPAEQTTDPNSDWVLDKYLIDPNPLLLRTNIRNRYSLVDLWNGTDNDGQSYLSQIFTSEYVELKPLIEASHFMEGVSSTAPFEKALRKITGDDKKEEIRISSLNSAFARRLIKEIEADYAEQVGQPTFMLKQEIVRASLAIHNFFERNASRYGRAIYDRKSKSVTSQNTSSRPKLKTSAPATASATPNPAQDILRRKSDGTYERNWQGARLVVQPDKSARLKYANGSTSEYNPKQAQRSGLVPR
jgi:hypothetical protein